MLFARDQHFYRTLFRLLLVVALQNVAAYSVNVADNLMLGSYSQEALSGAATVNGLLVETACGVCSVLPELRPAVQVPACGDPRQPLPLGTGTDPGNMMT